MVSPVRADRIDDEVTQIHYEAAQVTSKPFNSHNFYDTLTKVEHEQDTKQKGTGTMHTKLDLLMWLEEQGLAKHVVDIQENGNWVEANDEGGSSVGFMFKSTGGRFLGARYKDALVAKAEP